MIYAIFHFITGDPRVAFTPAQTTAHTMFARYHNYIARYLKNRKGQTWSYDKLFFEVSHYVIRTKSKEEGKDQESIQSGIKLDMGHHMESDKAHENITHNGAKGSAFSSR